MKHLSNPSEQVPLEINGSSNTGRYKVSKKQRKEPPTEMEGEADFAFLIEKIIVCKTCQSETCIKAGIVRGKQRYECKACHTHFTESDLRIKLTSEDRLRAVRFCLRGVSLTAVAQMFSTSATSLRRWIKEEKKNPHKMSLPDDKRDDLSVKLWIFSSKRRNNFFPIKPGRFEILKFKLERIKELVQTL